MKEWDSKKVVNKEACKCMSKILKIQTSGFSCFFDWSIGDLQNCVNFRCTE